MKIIHSKPLQALVVLLQMHRQRLFISYQKKGRMKSFGCILMKRDGIGYTLGRTNINSCDFSSDMYTYVPEGDKALKGFDISHDRKYKIPFIEAALKKTGGKMKLFVSPWSPPAFMKDNNNMLQGGKLLPEYYSSWANYYVKFHFCL